MCEICDQLVNTPKNKKSWVVLKEEKESEFTNYDRTFIEVNHDKKGNRYAFISHEMQLKNNRAWAQVIDISYCPFCGQNLMEE